MPGLTSIFLPEKCRHLLLSSEQQQLEATDLLQIDLLDSTAVLRCFLPFSLPLCLPLFDSLPPMVARVYQSGSATVANLNPILRTHFLCAGCWNGDAETRCPSLNLLDPALSPSTSADGSAGSIGVPNLQGRARTQFTSSTSST